MATAWLILTKDLRLRLRDRSVLLFAVVIPLGLTFVFSTVIPDAEDVRFRAAVVDADGGPLAAGFRDGPVAGLVDAELVDLDTSIGDATSARRAIEDGELDVAWIVPDGFSDRVGTGGGGRLEVLVGSGSSLTGEIARSVAQGFATEVDRVTLTVATAGAAAGGSLEPEELEALVADASAVTPSPTVELAEVADAQLDTDTYLAAGMAVFFLFFTVQFGITGILEERQQGTLPRLLAAPVRPVAIHAGKALGAGLLGIVSMTVLLVAATVLLGARFGPLLPVAVLTFAAVAAALGVMLLVGSFARTAEQAGNLQSIVALVLGLTGGVFFPVGTGALATLSLASPHGWYLRGLGDLAAGGTLVAVLPAVGALVAFAVIAAVPGALRVRRAVPR